MKNGVGCSVISRKAQKSIAGVIKDMEREIKTHLREQKSRVKEVELLESKERQKKKEMEEACRIRTQKQILSAKKGLASLIALGESSVMRRLFSYQRRINEVDHIGGTECFCFFNESSAWYSVHIHILPKSIEIIFPEMSGSSYNVFDFQYGDLSDHEEMVEKIVLPSVRKRVYIKELDQGDIWWVPGAVVTKALVRCANKKKLEEYLAAALKRNKR